MGVRGLAPENFRDYTLQNDGKQHFFEKFQCEITCFKSPFHEITTKFLANHAVQTESSITNSRVEDIKITKSRA